MSIKQLKPSLDSDHNLKFLLAPYPALIADQFDFENSTYATIKDGALMGFISRYIGKNAVNSYVITPKTSHSYDESDCSMIIKGKDEEEEEDEDQKPNDIKKPKDRTIISVGIGWHEAEFEGKTIRVLYNSLGNPVGVESCVKTYEYLLLAVQGTDQIQFLQKFCDYLIILNEKTKDETFNVYQYHIEFNYWSNIIEKTSRGIDTIVLPEAMLNQLTREFDEFLSPKTFKWYKRHGIPYKRSFLFYGPPGSGKSSMIQALAGKYKRNVCFVQPLNKNFTDSSFTSCVQSAPSKALIVLEDIDAYFGKDRKSLNQNCPLTFSGLLNGLDGVGSAEGQIFILTTNFIDRLDDALIRSGRVDRKIEFPAVDPVLGEVMFLQFYPGEQKYASIFREGLSKHLEKKESNVTLCMADLQQHFITHRTNGPELASTDLSDITGREYELLKERAEKVLKAAQEEDKEQKEEEQTTTTTSTSTTSTEKTDNKTEQQQHNMKLFGGGFGVGLLASTLSVAALYFTIHKK